MKTKPKRKYHSLIIRIPIDLWSELQPKIDSGYSSYSGYIVELIRKDIENDKKD